MLSGILSKIIKNGNVVFHAMGIKELLDFFKNLAKNKEVQGKAGEVVQKALDGKGLKDEGYFAKILVKAEELTDVDPNRMQFIKNCMAKITQEDYRVGTKHAQNIRLMIIAADLNETGELKIPTEDKNGKITGSTTITDPEYIPSSVSVIANMAERCQSESEVLMYLYSIGAFQDAPMGTLDEFQFWVRNTLAQKLKNFGEGTAFYAELLLEEFYDFTAKHYCREEERIRHARTAPWTSNKGFLPSIPVFFKKLVLVIFEA